MSTCIHEQRQSSHACTVIARRCQADYDRTFDAYVMESESLANAREAESQANRRAANVQARLMLEDQMQEKMVRASLAVVESAAFGKVRG